MRKKKYPIIVLSTALIIFLAACSNVTSNPPIQDNETGDMISAEELSDVNSSSSENEFSSSSIRDSSSSANESSSSIEIQEESSSSIADESSSSAEIQEKSSSSTDVNSSSSAEVNSVESVETPSSSSVEPPPESSNSEQEVVESSSAEMILYSSSMETLPESSSSEIELPLLESSSSSEEQSSSSENEPESSCSLDENVLSEECIALRSALDTFPQVTELLKCLRKTEKIAFILRHSERDKSKSGTKDPLNDNGRKIAYELGEKLKDVDDIYFMHTRVYRTMETILKIVEGKGQSFSQSTVPFSSKEGLDHMETIDLEDSYLIKDSDRFQECRSRFGWGWSPYPYVAYEIDVNQPCQESFYNVNDRLAEFIKNYFTYEKMHNITIGISHDKLLVPYAIVASNHQAHLQFHEHENDFNYWINYLTGIAIIVDEDGSTTVLPTTAMNDPYLRVFPDDF